MRRADDVFFFTLIDFLLQVFFFGVLLYVLNEASRAEAERHRGVEAAEVQQLKDAAGVSNLTELTDYLTKLAPLRELQGIADFIARAGGLEKAEESVKVVADAGGASAVSESLARLQKLEQGAGKPHCLFDDVAGKRIGRSVARVEVTDTHITFRDDTADLSEVLTKVGASYEEVQHLPLSDFRRRFAPLRALQCQYRLDVEVSTQLLAPMDAIWSAFYIRRL